MRDLIIYKKALELIIKVYRLIKDSNSLHRDFSLCDQLKRASVSVLTNIAEGYYRSNKQSKNYLQISSGSTNEVVALLDVVCSIYKIEVDKLQEDYKILGRQINAFSKTLITDN